jgi:deazaflavin-dependent oxidoreductase (nitroreductase family)
MTEPPTWLVEASAAALRTRWFVRAPIGLYRRGWGWLLGERLLMLEHRGRRSGLARHVVLEVLGRPRPGSYLVAAGFGERAQWLLNVRAEPRVRVSTGRHRSVPATARELDRASAGVWLERYTTEHPFAWKVLSATMQDGLGTDVGQLPVVELTLLEPPGAEPGGRPQ